MVLSGSTLYLMVQGMEGKGDTGSGRSGKGGVKGSGRSGKGCAKGSGRSGKDGVPLLLDMGHRVEQVELAGPLPPDALKAVRHTSLKPMGCF